MQNDMDDKQTIARILIADSNPLFSEKMKQIIADNFKSILTYEASSENEVLNEISRHAFDLLILDLELSDGNGFTLLKKILLVTPDIPILIMGMFPNEQYEGRVFRAGAHGYVSKVNLSNELITALHQISQGKKYFSSQGTGHSGKN